jgi:hypothetical protein
MDERGPLDDRQGIHIRPQSDRTPRSACAPKRSDDTGLPQPTVHIDAPFPETIGDEIGCPNLLETEFGMRVDVTP